MSEYEVGQAVFVVPLQRHAGAARDAVVTKVGRKWVYLGERTRFDPMTGCVDGGGYASPARVWASRDAHERHTERSREWSRIAAHIRHAYSVPEHLTGGDLALIAEILRIEPSHD